MEDELDVFNTKLKEEEKAFEQREANERKEKEKQEICFFLSEIKQKIETLNDFPHNKTLFKGGGWVAYIPANTPPGNKIMLLAEDKEKILNRLRNANTIAHFPKTAEMHPEIYKKEVLPIADLLTVWRAKEIGKPLEIKMFPARIKNKRLTHEEGEKFSKELIAELDPDGGKQVYYIKPDLNKIDEFLKQHPDIEYSASGKKSRKKFTFKSFKGTTKYKGHSIYVGSVEILIPPSTDQDRFCETMYKHKVHGQVDIEEIYKQVASVHEVDVYDNSYKIKVREAMKAVNDKVKEKLNTEERLFSSVKGEYIIRYY